MTDHNSIANQTIKEKFVGQHIIMLASQLVADGSKKLLFNDCDIYEVAENLYLETDEEAVDIGYDSIENARMNGADVKEVYEWWFVSSYLFDKLKEHGEVVYNSDYGYLWGRQCTGQAILLDGIISTICSEMEIMDGQKYSWGK